MPRKRLTDEQKALVEQHHAFKVNAANVLHLWGYDQSVCETFDQVLRDAGIPPRARNVRYAGGKTAATALLVGEDTVEAFEQWKTNAATSLTEAGERYGYNEDVVNEVLRNAGFDVPEVREVTATIEGTFKVPMTVKIVGNENLIDAVNRRTERTGEGPRGEVYRRWNDEVGADGVGVTWKAVMPDEDAPSDG